MSTIFWLLLLYGYIVNSTFLLLPGQETTFRYTGWAIGKNSTAEVFGCFVKAQVVKEPWLRVGLNCYNHPLDNKTEKHKGHLDMPFVFLYQDGIVRKLQFSTGDSVKSMNLKRAIASLFQVDMNRVPREDDEGCQGETTIEGNCDVVYSTVEQGNTFYVTKAINFNSCNNRQDVRYGLRYTIPCPDCQENRNIDAKTVYSYIIENGTLHYAEVVSRHHIAVNRELLLETTLAAKLEFYSMKDIQYPLSQPEVTDIIQDLAYSNKELEHQELFLKYRREEEKKLQDKKFLEFYVDEAHKARSIRWHPLKELLLHSSYSEIVTAMQKMYKDGNERVYIIERGLASAGTVNTVRVLLYFWKERRISNERVTMLLKDVQETDFPSMSLIDLLLEYSEGEDSFEQDNFLLQSVWLAIGELARATFGPTGDKMARKSYRLEDNKRLVEKILQKHSEADDIEEKLLFVKVMGNAALREFLQPLQEIVMNNEETFAMRLEAIYSLRILKDIYPYKVKKLLLPIFLDENDTPEIRMAALTYFLHCMPEKALLDLVVTQMEKEKDNEVAGFTYSSLLSISRSMVPCLPSFSRDVALSISQLYNRPKTRKSFYEHTHSSKPGLLTAVSLDTITIHSNGANHPLHQIFSYEIVAGGNWLQYFLQFSYTQLDQEDDGDRFLVSMRYKQMDFGFMVVNRSAFEELLHRRDFQQFGNYFQEFKKHFSDGPDIKALVHLPTAIGLPITHSVKVDSLMAIWFLFKEDNTLQPAVFTHVGYKNDDNSFQMRQSKIFPICVDKFLQ